MENTRVNSPLAVHARWMAWRPDSPTDPTAQIKEEIIQDGILVHGGRQLSCLGVDVLADRGIDGPVLDGWWQQRVRFYT